MNQDNVDIDPQTVANGLGVWDAMSSTLQARWGELTGQIETALGAAPWGTDSPGSAFNTSFMDEGRAAGFKAYGQPFVDRVHETGQNVRRVVSQSLGADQQQAGEVGGVGVPSFNSGGGGGSSSGGGGGAASGGGGGAPSGGSVAMMSSGGMSASSLPAAGQTQGELVMEEVGGYAVGAPGGAQWLPGPGPGQGQGEVVPGSSQYLPADQSGTPSQLSYAGQPLTTDTVHQFPERPESLHGAGAPDGGGSKGEAPSTGGSYTIQPAPQGERGDGGPAVGDHEWGSDSGSSRQVPDGLVEKIRERIDQLPDGAIKHLPDGVLQNLPDGVIQQLPEGVIQQLPEGIADRLSDAGSPHVPMGEHTEFIPAGDEVTGRPDVKAPREAPVWPTRTGDRPS